MRKILVLLLLLPSPTFADEGGPTKLTKENTVFKSSYKLSDGRGIVHVVIRNDGEAMGFSYLVEVRPQCNGSAGNPDDFEVADVKSTCAVDAKSVSHNPEQQIVQVKVFDPDSRSYNLDSQKNPLTAKVRCLTKAAVHVIALDKYCRK